MPINVITVRQNGTIQKTRNKRRSKIKIKNWIIRAVDKYYNMINMTLL